MKRGGALFIVIVLIMFAGGCDQKPASLSTAVSSNEKIKIRIACTQIPYEILTAGLRWFQNQGVNAELVLMEQDTEIIKAVHDGRVDAAFGVSKKKMKRFNQLNHSQLVMIGPYFLRDSIGFYSDRYQSIAELPAKSIIAMTNDPVNLDRGLRLLHNDGIITLDLTKTDDFTLADVIENPKQLDFIRMDDGQTAHKLQAVDGSVVFFSTMFNAGKNFNHYLIRDHDADIYSLGIIVHASHSDKPWARTLSSAFISKAIGLYLEEQLGNALELFIEHSSDVNKNKDQ